MADQERRSGLSAAWGVVAALTGTGAVAVWIAARTTGTHVPIWPAYPLGALAVVALYMTFASLLGFWPARTRRPVTATPPAASVSEGQALPAAKQSGVLAVNPDEFKPYHAESGEFPDGKTLTFGFDHITDHPGAYMALSPRRCTVLTPSGVTTSATRLNRYYQYPQEFE